MNDPERRPRWLSLNAIISTLRPESQALTEETVTNYGFDDDVEIVDDSTGETIVITSKEQAENKGWW